MNIDNTDLEKALGFFRKVKAGITPEHYLQEAKIALDRYLLQYDDNDTAKDPTAMTLMKEIERRLEAPVSKNYPRD